MTSLRGAGQIEALLPENQADKAEPVGMIREICHGPPNGIPLPLALFAEACWDPDRNFAALLEKTMRRGGIRLA